MTTEPPTPTGPENQQPRAPTPGAATPSLGGMSGEMLVMVSGILILGVYVIFGLIANQWYPSFLSVVAATFAIILPRVGSIGSGITGSTLQKITGYVIAVAGLWDFVFNLRFGWGGFVDVVAWLLLGVAAVLAFLGARAVSE
ncbi:MAG TPA: hypothetical protein VHM29_09190 [Acidimicrobiia bacterium]|nr:hypothetical protein [Acidimicrobiia bacterium]